MEPEVYPTSVSVDRKARALRIDWETGSPTIIPWTVLRLHCPCAQCRGEDWSQAPDTSTILRSVSETDMADIKIMGHYAVQPTWVSGHATGIYTWEYLLEISELAERS